MKKVFWLAPLAVLVIFIGFYMKFQKEVEEKDLEHTKQVEADRQKRIAENNKIADENKERARIELEKTKKKAQEEKDRIAAEKKAREELEYQEQFAWREALRYANLVADLQKNLSAEKEGKEKAEAITAATKQEKIFLVEFIAKAEANKKSLNEVLLSIAAAEKAKAEADAAAKAVKKNS